jgi:putative transposase
VKDHHFPVCAVCRLLDVPRAAFYRTRHCGRDDEDVVIVAKIEQIIQTDPGVGTRRVSATLKLDGRNVGRRRAQRLMRERSLLCRLRKRWTKTTDSCHGHPRYPNLVRQFDLTHLGQVWVSDITYIPLPKGFCFLAVVLDAYTRKVVGHHLSMNIDADLTLTALRKAIKHSCPTPGWIHHSDQGVQYACRGYVDLVTAHHGRPSMSRTGSPTQNAKAESFFATLKKEYVHLEQFESFEHAQEGISKYIDDYYNLRRMHSALGYLSPQRFEETRKNAA